MRSLPNFLDLAPSPRVLLAALLLALALPGCRAELDGPTVVVADPAPDAELPVSPGILCRMQHPEAGTPVIVSGEGLSPLPFDIPDDPTLALPSLSLLLHSDLAGAAIDPSEIVYGGEPGEPNAELLSWQTQSQLTFLVRDELLLAEGASGMLPVGIYDLRVDNPNGAQATTASSLAVTDRPRVSSVTPGITCLDEGPRTLTLDGETVLRIEGEDAFVRVGGDDFAVSGFERCTPIAHGAVSAQSCEQVTLELDQGAVAVGYPELTFQNPETAACSSVHDEDQINLRVVPAPTLEAAIPSLICSAEGTREVVLQGTGLLAIDGELPSVTLLDESGTVRTLTVTLPASTLAGEPNCSPLTTLGHTVELCSEASIVVPVENPSAPYKPTLTLTNPAPAGCAGSTDLELMLVPEPTLDAMVAPLSCIAQGDRGFTLQGTGFLGVDHGSGEVLPSIFVDGVELHPSDLGQCESLDVVGLTVRRCQEAYLLVPEGLMTVADGTWAQPELRLTNPAPAGCSGEHTTALTLVPPPTLASAEPSLVCTEQGTTEVVVTGTGFLSVGEGAGAQLPAVTVGGDLVTVSALAGCASVPAEGLTVEQCDQMTLTLPVGAGDPTNSEIVVTNPSPAGCGASDADALVIAPPPRIDSLAPPVLCDVGGPALVTLSGEHFLTVDGVVPEVTLAGTALPPGSVTALGCSPLTVPRLGVETCTTLEVTVSPGSFADSSVEVGVINPAPAGCSATAVELLSSVTPPVITTAQPALVCTDEGARTIVLQGTGFFDVGGVLPSVTLGGSPVQSQSITGCTPVTLGSTTAERCTELTVVAPQSSLSSGDVEVSLVNPAPIGCSVATATVLDAPPAIAIHSVAPSAVCAALAAPLTVTVAGEGFLDVDGALPTLTVAGATLAVDGLATCSSLSVAGMSVASCNELTFTVDPSTLSGTDIPIAITNAAPSSCGASATGVFFLTPPPTLTGVTTPNFCASDGGTIGLVGTNFTAGTQVTLESGTTVHVGTVTYNDPTSLEVTFPPGLDAGTYDLRVSATGCDDVLVGAVSVDPAPLVFFIDPPTVYNGVITEVTLFTTGLSDTYGASTVELLYPDGATTTSLPFTEGSRANRLLTPIPADDPENPGSPLPPGAFELQVTNALGCTSALNGSLTVTDTLTLELEGIDPAYVSPTRETAVSITAQDTSAVVFESTPRVYLNPNPPGAGSPVGLTAVLFESDRLLTAVVPAGMTPGDYDLIVVNPSGSVGLLPLALTVTPSEPPLVEVVVPAAVDAIADSPAQIRGSGFATDAGGVGVDLDCRDTVGATYTFSATNVTVVDAGTIDVTLPVDSAGVPIGSVCLLTVTNLTEGSSFTYSAVSVKNASQNLNAWSQLTPMNEGRRALALIAGRPTNTSRFLYAIGGDGGDFSTAKTSVEAVGVDVFGGFTAAGWQDQRNALPAPRSNAGFARIGRFLYLTGGHRGPDGGGSLTDGETNTSLRAEILDPRTTPELVDLDADLLETGGLSAGLYFYEVSATFPSNDPSNPSGESLPGEVLTVQLPAISVGGIELTLKWDDLRREDGTLVGANGYRVYRALPVAGGGAGDFELLHSVTCGADTTCLCGIDFDCEVVDVGQPTDPASLPLMRGALGVWHDTTDFLTPREGHATVALRHPDPLKADTWYLYVFGGRNDTSGALDTYEWATVTVAADGSQTVSAWTTGSKAIGGAKSNLAAWVLDADETAHVGGDEVYVFLGTGLNDAGNPVNGLASGWLDTTSTDGDLFSAGATALDPEDGPASARGAACFGDANGFIFTFGGFVSGGLANDRSAEVVAGPDLANVWQAPGGGDLNLRRSYCASAQESAFFFTAGGTTATETATTSVETTVQ
ncbi:MAG: hypothetical protein P1V51_22090 [Deltaproteobacteria bacterium]|nr:hypothetical protein [Deltaproteobacteria bacterium]